MDVTVHFNGVLKINILEDDPDIIERVVNRTLRKIKTDNDNIREIDYEYYEYPLVD